MLNLNNVWYDKNEWLIFQELCYSFEKDALEQARIKENNFYSIAFSWVTMPALNQFLTDHTF